MASGWNLRVWLVSVVVRSYIIDILIIIITFPYSTCISSFLAASSLFLCSFFKLILYYFKVPAFTATLLTDPSFRFRCQHGLEVKPLLTHFTFDHPTAVAFKETNAQYT